MYCLAIFTTVVVLAIQVIGQETAATATVTNCNVITTRLVIAGDGLVDIGKANNVSLSQLLLVNPQISNARLINPGDKLNIPNSACVAPEVKALAEPTATCSNGTQNTIKVASGDTFIIIAKEKLGITVPALQSVNPQVKDLNILAEGDVLNVPLCAPGGLTTASAPPTTSPSAASEGIPPPAAAAAAAAPVPVPAPTPPQTEPAKEGGGSTTSVTVTTTNKKRSRIFRGSKNY